MSNNYHNGPFWWSQIPPTLVKPRLADVHNYPFRTPTSLTQEWVVYGPNASTRTCLILLWRGDINLWYFEFGCSTAFGFKKKLADISEDQRTYYQSLKQKFSDFEPKPTDPEVNIQNCPQAEWELW